MDDYSQNRYWFINGPNDCSQNMHPFMDTPPRVICRDLAAIKPDIWCDSACVGRSVGAMSTDSMPDDVMMGVTGVHWNVQ